MFLQGTRSALYANDRESITVTVQEVTPRSVGALIALYERAVGIYASLVNINAYHQPGKLLYPLACKWHLGVEVRNEGQLLWLLNAYVSYSMSFWYAHAYLMRRPCLLILSSGIHLRCGSWEKGSWRSISSSEAGFDSTQWGKVKSHILQSASNFLIFTFCLPSTFPCIILSMSGQFLSLRVSHCFDLCVPHKILRYLLSCQYPKKKKELGFICALKTILDKFTK